MKASASLAILPFNDLDRQALYSESPLREPLRLKCLDRSCAALVHTKQVKNRKFQKISLANFDTNSIFTEQNNYDFNEEENITRYSSHGAQNNISLTNLDIPFKDPIKSIAVDTESCENRMVGGVNSLNELFFTPVLKSGSNWSFRDRSVNVLESSTNVSSNGWCSLVFNGTNKYVCHVNYIQKSIQWTDVESLKPIRTTDSVQSPSALCENKANSSCMNFICEHGFVSGWDHRKNDQGGCVERALVSREALWSICRMNEHEICVAGMDRVVYLFDIRTWKCRQNWRSPCKYDIVHLLPSSNPLKPWNLYLVGSDNEILLSNVQPMRYGSQNDNTVESSNGSNHASLPNASKLRISHHRGIRAESRWVGVDLFHDEYSGDTISGFCDEGKFYLLQHADDMALAMSGLGNEAKD